MIEKIISIKNIGRFLNCTPRGNVTFKKMTLLLAENGRGKTTLCGIFRSLQTGQHEYISERKTLGVSNPSSVQIRLDGSTITFSNNAWSTTHTDIAIFDSVFVHDNVYAGDYINYDHKKKLFRVIIGTQGVQLARQVEELDEKIRKANNDIRTKKSALTLPNGITIDEYLDWKPEADIDGKIQQKEIEIAKQQHVAEKNTEIQDKGLLKKITLPEFPSEFLTILAKELTDITSDAETRVREQIVDHNMGDQGEIWLSQGLDFVVDNKCPFCDQDLNEIQLLSVYRSHFNTAYVELKQKVAELTERVESSIGLFSLSAIQQSLSNNSTLIEFWKQFTEMDLPDFLFEDVRTKYESLLNITLALARQKEQAPIDSISPEANFQVALESITMLQESLDSYNEAIDICNARINEQKVAAQQSTDINLLRRELAKLEAKKKRFEPAVIQASKEFQDALTEKEALDQQKIKAKERLDQHCQQILNTYQGSINTCLDQFNTGFRIVNSRHLYTGGAPSSSFQIEINSHAVDLGDSRTQSGTPCFKTTLSSGDRSALAFAFFLASMNSDPRIENKIVVFDDPFTSQDRFRRVCTQQLIRQLADKAEQVIVLSHAPHFLKLLWENSPTSEIKVLQMCRTGDNTIIGELDIVDETQSTYLKNYSALLDFYREHKGVPLDVARSIRPFIEGLLRAHFPGRFQPTEWLGDFIRKIRNADDSDGLSHAKEDLSEIEAINNYSKRYHHDQNPNADSETISNDELHGYVKRTLRLAGGC